MKPRTGGVTIFSGLDARLWFEHDGSTSKQNGSFSFDARSGRYLWVRLWSCNMRANGSGMTTDQRMIEEKYVVSFLMRGGEWRIANNSGNQRWRGHDHRCAHRWSMEKSCYISWNDGFTVDSLAMTNGIIAVCRVKYFNIYDVLMNSLYMTFILAVDNVFSKCKRFFGASVLFVCTVRHKRIKRFVFIYNLYTSKL